MEASSCKCTKAIIQLRKDNARMKTALKRIEKWFGEFPSVKCTDGTEIAYFMAYGSMGEREYMRKVAREALNPVKKTKVIRKKK